jgi:exonuclease III
MVATVLTVCWDPHTANRIGEAAKPGPVCIVSRNIHGIYSNLMQCIRTKADIICIQEADITESDVLDFTGQALTAGYTCKWGQPLQIAKTSGGKNGRRVAMLIKNPVEILRRENMDAMGDSNLMYLRASGRWMECMIPVGDGSKQIIVATLYGISGANTDNPKYEENERLIAAALIRMNTYKDIAYYICTDINVEPSRSEVLTKAREACLAYDLVAVFLEGKPPPTFKADGVVEGMTGTGVTRLDTIIANGVATHAIDTIGYDYQHGKGFDHVPLNLKINEEKFKDEIETPTMPSALTLRTLTGMTQGERNKTLKEEATWFGEIWQLHKQEFENALHERNVEEAHRLWCLAAEQFLWKCQRLDSAQMLPKNDPRRGQVMPKHKQQVAGRLCKETGIARNAFTSKIDKVLGTAHDLLMRLRRLANTS